MKCSCCDRDLSDKEIVWNEEIGNWELCTTCLDVALDAAQGNGFNIQDEEHEYAVEDDFDMFVPYAEVDELDRHVFGSFFDEERL